MKKTLSIFLLLSIKIAVFSQTSILEDNLMKDAEVAFLQINPTIGGDVTIESTFYVFITIEQPKLIRNIRV